MCILEFKACPLPLSYNQTIWRWKDLNSIAPSAPSDLLSKYFWGFGTRLELVYFTTFLINMSWWLLRRGWTNRRRDRIGAGSRRSPPSRTSWSWTRTTGSSGWPKGPSWEPEKEVFRQLLPECDEVDPKEVFCGFIYCEQKQYGYDRGVSRAITY